MKAWTLIASGKYASIFYDIGGIHGGFKPCQVYCKSSAPRECASPTQFW